MKDGRDFDLRSEPDRISQYPGEGTFVIRKIRPEDKGVYQCYAKNGNGTAVDKEIKFDQTCKLAIRCF